MQKQGHSSDLQGMQDPVCTEVGVTFGQARFAVTTCIDRYVYIFFTYTYISIQVFSIIFKHAHEQTQYWGPTGTKMYTKKREKKNLTYTTKIKNIKIVLTTK